jgi:hypothetical protein
MRIIYSYGGMILLLFSACQADKKKETSETTGAAIEVAAQELCFRDVTGADSLLIQLTVQGVDVTGTLRWLPAEKDKMQGTLKGTVENSIITALYTYQAEGVTAREERIFRISSDSIFMKTGELIEENGIWVLKDKQAAAFAVSAPKVSCR